MVLSIDFTEDKSDLDKMSPESNGISEKVGLDFKKDSHISNMCPGKPLEGVPLNHKLGTMNKVVQEDRI